jgi:beta-lactam-binding protein with PASTA domain
VRVCPACHRENPEDSDFCQYCGEYLRWDPTVATPAVRPPSGPGPAPAQVPPGMRPIPQSGGGRGPADAVSITLRSLTDDSDPREGVRVACEPGATATLVASVRNQSGIVDNYDLRVEGLPEGWWTITPPTAYLVPYGAPSGRYEQDAQVHLHPPKSAQAEARDWPIRVVAGSRANGADAGSASARLTVQPYQNVETDLRPERATGRRKGKFAFAVRNLANAPIELEFAATDPEDKCKFAIKTRRGIARPGHRTGTELMVKAPKHIWVGRPLDHPFTIHARSPGTEEILISRQAVFRQRPWFAWWVPIAIVAALALGVAGYKLLQSPPTIAVPDLTGKSASAVQSLLEKLGLLLTNNPAATKIVAAKDEIGKIVSQNPGPGFKLSPGKAVAVVVGVGAKQVPVPNVCGKSLGDAQKALKGADLSVGPVQPSGADPKTMTLGQGCEVPAANQSVAQGSPVSLFLQSSGGNAAPSVQNLSAADAASKLQAAGLKTITIPVLATTVPVGNVVTQKPGQGASLAKGSTVYLYVSALPRVAYDSGGSVYVSSFGASGPSGSPLRLTSSTAAIEPSWNADGTELTYVDRTSGSGTVEIVAADGKSQPRPVATGADYHRPVFAPLAGSGVIAFTRWDGGTQSALCFLDTSQANATPSCTTPTSQLLDRPTWAPNGMSIAVLAETPGNPPTTAGVIRFTTTTPFSADATAWQADSAPYLAHPNNPTNDPTFLAYSPLNGTSFSLAYAQGNSIFLTGDPPTSPGSKVYDYSVAPAFSWRIDGVLEVGGLDCSTQPPGIVVVAQSGGTSTPLGVNGCDPSVEPLPLPPSG